MSTIVKTGWLNDKNGDKFAPKTLLSQVQTSDGVLLEDKIQSDLDGAIATKTSVTSGGSHVETFNADTKLDKVTTGGSYARVYAVSGSGEQKMYNISASVIFEDGVVTRLKSTTGGSGQILVPTTPAANGHATSKQYVDAQDDTVLADAKSYTDEIAADSVGLKTEGMTYTDANGNTYTCGMGEVFNHYSEQIILDASDTPTNGNLATSDGSHAEGVFTLAKGDASHTEGYQTKAYGMGSHAEGGNTKAHGIASHVEGQGTTATGDYSHAEGYYTESLGYQHAQGHYNNTTLAKAGVSSGTGAGTAFVIGNGTESAKSNAFRVTYDGKPYAKSSLASSGCDYAEFFEWKDLNPNSEDRRGYFVTLDGEQIKIAQPNDYILGIISALPSVIGNGDEDWMGRYVFDEFGAFVYEDFEYEIEVPEQVGDEIVMKTVVKTGKRYKENPDYDPSLEYIQREDRPEWDAVGMLGVLSVRDDGTCKVNGYCKVAEGGIATESETGYRVIKRVNDNIVKVIFR